MAENPFQTDNYLTSESLSIGDFVNIWDDKGMNKVRKAVATSESNAAQGFVMCNVPAGADVRIYRTTVNQHLSGLLPGVMHFLSADNPGKVVAKPPCTDGQVVQLLGTATSATELKTNIKPPILLR
jgi:hypothetical protein